MDSLRVNTVGTEAHSGAIGLQFIVIHMRRILYSAVLAFPATSPPTVVPSNRGRPPSQIYVATIYGLVYGASTF
jgi:hypothetical protein